MSEPEGRVAPEKVRIGSVRAVEYAECHANCIPVRALFREAQKCSDCYFRDLMVEWEQI